MPSSSRSSRSRRDSRYYDEDDSDDGRSRRSSRTSHSTMYSTGKHHSHHHRSKSKSRAAASDKQESKTSSRTDASDDYDDISYAPSTTSTPSSQYAPSNDVPTGQVASPPPFTPTAAQAQTYPQQANQQPYSAQPTYAPQMQSQMTVNPYNGSQPPGHPVQYAQAPQWSMQQPQTWQAQMQQPQTQQQAQGYPSVQQQQQQQQPSPYPTNVAAQTQPYMNNQQLASSPYAMPQQQQFGSPQPFSPPPQQQQPQQPSWPQQQPFASAPPTPASNMQPSNAWVNSQPQTGYFAPQAASGNQTQPTYASAPSQPSSLPSTPAPMNPMMSPSAPYSYASSASAPSWTRTQPSAAPAVPPKPATVVLGSWVEKDGQLMWEPGNTYGRETPASAQNWTSPTNQSSAPPSAPTFASAPAASGNVPNQAWQPSTYQSPPQVPSQVPAQYQQPMTNSLPQPPQAPAFSYNQYQQNAQGFTAPYTTSHSVYSNAAQAPSIPVRSMSAPPQPSSYQPSSNAYRSQPDDEFHSDDDLTDDYSSRKSRSSKSARRNSYPDSESPSTPVARRKSKYTDDESSDQDKYNYDDDDGGGESPLSDTDSDRTSRKSKSSSKKHSHKHHKHRSSSSHKDRSLSKERSGKSSSYSMRSLGKGRPQQDANAAAARAAHEEALREAELLERSYARPKTPSRRSSRVYEDDEYDQEQPVAEERLIDYDEQRAPSSRARRSSLSESIRAYEQQFSELYVSGTTGGGGRASKKDGKKPKIAPAKADRIAAWSATVPPPTLPTYDSVVGQRSTMLSPESLASLGHLDDQRDHARLAQQHAKFQQPVQQQQPLKSAMKHSGPVSRGATMDLEDVIDPFSPAPEAALLYGTWHPR